MMNSGATKVFTQVGGVLSWGLAGSPIATMNPVLN